MKTCPNCGTINQATVTACARCGRDLASSQGARKGLATTSLALGIASYPLMCAFGAGLITAVLAIVCGIVALVRVNRAPQQFGGKGSAISGLVLGGLAIVLIPVWLIVAAIAIPSLLRARMAANESAAVGDVRTLISAEATYAAANGGYYDKLECLAQPQSCIPGPSAPRQALVSALMANTAPRRGYEFALYVGAPAPLEDGRSASRSSVTSFAYVAAPMVAGRTGLKTFCGDESGVIRFSPEGRASAASGGRCPETWPILQ